MTHEEKWKVKKYDNISHHFIYFFYIPNNRKKIYGLFFNFS